VKLLRIAWHQASLADDPLGRAMAASELIELLVDFGDIQTAELLAQAIDVERAPSLKDLAEVEFKRHVDASRSPVTC